METIGIIWKLCNPYALPITIIEVKKSDETIKIHLYSDIIDFNETTIKDIRHIPH